MNLLKTYAPVFTTFQKATDVLIVLAGTWAIGAAEMPPMLARGLALYGSVLTLILFSYFDIYRSWRKASLFQQLKSLFFSWIAVLIGINVVILALSGEEHFKLLWPFALFRAPVFYKWALIIFLGMAVVRIVVKSALSFIRSRGYNVRRAVIVGAGQAGQRIGNDLVKDTWMGIELDGYFDDNRQAGDPVLRYERPVGKVIGPIVDCEDYVRSRKIEMVFIALPMSQEVQINHLMWELGTRGVTVYMVPDFLALGIQKAKMYDTLGGLPLLDLNLFPTWKRSFDIIFSLLIILVALPVWLVVVLLIKLEDRGPIFYRHPRVMESGKRFGCLKFRTMHIDADERLKDLLEKDPALQEEWRKSFKLKNDPRITKVGRFLRKTSLDELPQFVNVLKGEMSVVGARPIVVEELRNYYGKTALTYCSMKPGITGPWQVGKRNDVTDYQERVEMDRRYVLTCSLMSDLKIIGKTVLRMIWPKGAY